MSDKLKNTIKAIQKKYGEDVYVSKNTNEYTVISTGNGSMDNATGVGGFPLGKIVELMAWEGTGKSTVALHVIAEAQKMGLVCSLLDTEHSYDFDYGANIGVNADDLLIFNPELLEDAANITVDLIKSEEVHVIVLDSMSALSTSKEKEGDVGDSNMGVKARLVGQFMRKIKGIADKHKVLVIIIGQLREKMTLYGDPTTTDYGNAVKFFADIRIMLSKKLAKEGDDIIGNAVTAKFIKNKIGKPYQNCEFMIAFGKGYDTINELYISAKEHLPKDIYNKRGDNVVYKTIKYKVEQFNALIETDEDFREDFRKTIQQYLTIKTEK
jgi:recombination protein RecA